MSQYDNVCNSLSAIFNKYNTEIFALMEKYPSQKGHDRCLESTPLSAEDKEKFLQNRNDLLNEIRTSLPGLIKENPNFMTSDIFWKYYEGDPEQFKSSPEIHSKKSKYLAIGLVFKPHQKSRIHSHNVSCVSYVIEGEMMEAECKNGIPIHVTPKKAGESTVVSPHETHAKFNQHMVFSSGLYPRSVLLHVYDCIALTPRGTIKDLSTNGDRLKQAISNDIYPKLEKCEISTFTR